jgi:hypothetical protein
MKLYQMVRVAGIALCVGSTLSVAQAAPKSVQVKEEQNVPASRLHVGDVIYAMHAAMHETVFDGKGIAVKVVSLSPLTLNISGKSGYIGVKNAKMSIGNFALITATGQRSGTTGVIAVTQPNNVKFTRLAPQVTREQNVPATGLRIGDVVYAMEGKGGAWQSNGGAQVVSLSPLTLNIKSPRIPFRDPTRMRIGNFAVVTSPGRLVGAMDVLTVTKPAGVKFTRSKS